MVGREGGAGLCVDDGLDPGREFCGFVLRHAGDDRVGAFARVDVGVAVCCAGDLGRRFGDAVGVDDPEAER